MDASRLNSKFEGCLLGSMLGDILGAAVEGESSGYIRKTFRSLDDFLSLDLIDEPLGGTWKFGRYTDDTQMTLAVAEWILEGSTADGKDLLRRFSEAYDPQRRYGPGTRYILELFKSHPDQWASLATAMFPTGSYGNGSAMRVAPVGLRFHRDFPALLEAARVSSRVTHSHPLALQGAALQATAIALATRCEASFHSIPFLKSLGATLGHFEQRGQDTSRFRDKLRMIEEALAAPSATRTALVTNLGCGIEVTESLPLALYSFLSHPDSFEQALEAAIFQGGDTDTIAAMTGAIAGALLGVEALPERWVARIDEADYPPSRIREIARGLVRLS